MDTQEKKDQIAKAFMDMALTQPVEAIRVNELIKRAGVSKATFYRMFQDKYEVMNWVYLRTMQPTISKLPQLSHVRTWSLASFTYIRENKKFFRNIISYHGQNSFYALMVEFFTGNMKKAILEKAGQEALTEKVLFSVEAYSHVSAFTIEKWIQDNCEMDENVLLEYTKEWIPDCLREFFEP